MLNINEYINQNSSGLEPLFTALLQGKNASVFGLPLGARTIVSSLKKPCVYVCADYISAVKIHSQFLCLNKNTVLLLAKDDVLSFRKSRSQDSEQARLFALTKIASDEAEIIVTTAEAAIQLYPDKNEFLSRILSFKKNSDYDVGILAQMLVRAGYKREAQVELPGQFSLRGDILDIWASGQAEGVRLEFFGDTLEKIKHFGIAEQTTDFELESIVVPPATEYYFGDLDTATLATIKKELDNLEKASERGITLSAEINLTLAAGGVNPELSFLTPLISHTDFAGFVSPEFVFFDDAKAVSDTINILYTEHQNRFKSLFARGEAYKSLINQLIDKSKALQFDCQKLAFHRLDSANRIFTPDAVFNFKSIELEKYHRDLKKLCDDVKAWISNGYKVVLFCGSQKVKDSVEDLFSAEGVGGFGGGKVELSCLKLDEGAVFFDAKTILIGTYNITQKSGSKVIKRAKSDVFSQPEVGGYVVHYIHGVGFCESVSRLEIAGASRDYFVISYLGGDKLYVPIENMDSLTKFSSPDEQPKLNKIGGADFARIKQRVKGSVKQMAFSLLDLYAKRSDLAGHKYSDDDTFVNEFCDGFEFEETPDQLDAVSDGLNDLKSGKIMDRLICGDVGYGKTEVALRLAFKVITEGRQVAFLAPTTILARQHFETVKKRMQVYGVRVVSLTRFNSAVQIKQSLQKIECGEADIVVGTHRLLSDDVKFFKLGLLILDEEQRFGVADKEKIKRIKNDVGVLAMSATPIPRTLHMSMSGIRDISVLDTPPKGRIPVQTYVTELSDTLIIDAVMREIGRGGQVFIVYNRVETIERFAAKVKTLLPELKILSAHGQMSEKNLENVITDFVDGKADVLIATTIIENGIDMPRANTMLVIDSDRFGLSQLYQLRGRVGRSDRLAYVYFTFDGAKALTDDAYKRLEAVTEYTEFGSGFKIAMRDLEIRGAGNILGAEQHGHIAKIGYEMYTKLLKQAVDELKGEGEEQPLEYEVKVHTDFNAFIPESYISDSQWRIRAYSRISRIKDEKELKQLKADLQDIYGALPQSAENLLAVAMVKNRAAAMRAKSVILKKNECSIIFDKARDIPPEISKIKGVRLNLAEAKVDFGCDRSTMLKFLLTSN